MNVYQEMISIQEMPSNGMYCHHQQSEAGLKQEDVCMRTNIRIVRVITMMMVDMRGLRDMEEGIVMIMHMMIMTIGHVFHEAGKIAVRETMTMEGTVMILIMTEVVVGERVVGEGVTLVIENGT